jgi:hypothetical protein
LSSLLHHFCTFLTQLTTHLNLIIEKIGTYCHSIVPELPWDQPSSGCAEYLAWKENKYTTMTPWSKLDVLTLEMLRKILHHSPSSRLPLEKILEHKWCHYQFNDSGEFGVGLANESDEHRLIRCRWRSSTFGQVLSDSQLNVASV